MRDTTRPEPGLVHADLVGYLRSHYGRRGSGAWDTEPFPTLWPHGFSGLQEREIAELLGAPLRDPPGHARQLRESRNR